MKTVAISLIILLFFQVSRGQEFLLTYEIETPSLSTMLWSDSVKEKSLVLKSSKQYHALKLDENHRLTEKLVYEQGSGSELFIFGVFYIDQEPWIITTNYKRNRFTFIHFDFTQNRVKSYAYNRIFDEEIYLGAAFDQHAWYFLTIKKSSSVLRLHIFELDQKLQPHYRVENFDFTESFQDEPVRLSMLVVNVNPGKSATPSKVQSVHSSGKQALSPAFSAYKLFLSGEYMILSLDHEMDKAKLLIMNHQNLKADMKEFLHSTAQSAILKSNSFLYKDYLFQLNLDEKHLYLSITDWVNDRELMNKTYEFVDDDAHGLKGFNRIESDGELSEVDPQHFWDEMLSDNTRIGILGRKEEGQFELLFGAKYMPELLAQYAVPPILLPFLTDYSRRRDRFITFAEMTLNEDFQLVESEKRGESPEDKSLKLVEGFLQKRRELGQDVSMQKIIVAPFADYALLGYYDSHVKTYNLLKFKD